MGVIQPAMQRLDRRGKVEASLLKLALLAGILAPGIGHRSSAQGKGARGYGKEWEHAAPRSFVDGQKFWEEKLGQVGGEAFGADPLVAIGFADERERAERHRAEDRAARQKRTAAEELQREEALERLEEFKWRGRGRGRGDFTASAGRTGERPSWMQGLDLPEPQGFASRSTMQGVASGRRAFSLRPHRHGEGHVRGQDRRRDRGHGRDLRNIGQAAPRTWDPYMQELNEKKVVEARIKAEEEERE